MYLQSYVAAFIIIESMNYKEENVDELIVFSYGFPLLLQIFLLTPPQDKNILLLRFP